MREINVSPFANNVLDLVGRQTLVTADGAKVEILRGMTDFVVKVDGLKPFATDDNLVASRYLNALPLYEKDQ